MDNVMSNVYTCNINILMASENCTHPSKTCQGIFLRLYKKTAVVTEFWNDQQYLYHLKKIMDCASVMVNGLCTTGICK